MSSKQYRSVLTGSLTGVANPVMTKQTRKMYLFNLSRNNSILLHYGKCRTHNLLKPFQILGTKCPDVLASVETFDLSFRKAVSQ